MPRGEFQCILYVTGKLMISTVYKYNNKWLFQAIFASSNTISIYPLCAS